MHPRATADRAFLAVTATGAVATALVALAAWRLVTLHLPCGVARLPVIGELTFDPSAPCVARLPFVGIPTWTIGLLVAALFVALVVVGGASAARQWVATRRLVSTATATASPATPEVGTAARAAGWDPARVRVSAHPSVSAFCHGLVRPQVVVGAALVRSLDDAELASVIAHEAAHARHRDPLRLFVMRTAAAMACYVPVLPPVMSLSRAASEMAADLEAIDAVGRRPLLSALLHVTAWPTTPARAMVGGFDAELARVEHLTQRTPPRLALGVHRTVATVVIIVVAVLAVLWVAPALRPSTVIY